MDRTRTVARRLLLGLLGIALILGGAWPATGRAPLAGRLPAWWPAPAADGTLLDRSALSGLRAHGWWTPAVVATGSLLTALLAFWLLGRLRVGGRAPVPLAVPGGVLRTRALEEALAARVAAIDGVTRCRTSVRARRGHVRAGLRVWLAPQVPPDAVTEHLKKAVTEADRLLAPYPLDVRVRFTGRSHGMPRVR
ncbi:hypothetical protein [Streptomyces sp. NPDC005573]|uniref:hypothetical protein n=1 Tax=Streptomyces sp. NPDC005573 TaxID=3156890 RepID=UPI0033A62BC3